MPRLPLWTLALLGCAWLLAAGSLRAEESEVVAEPLFSADQLEQLVAPIALYPDSLVAQILMASTYPLEIVQAARWRQRTMHKFEYLPKNVDAYGCVGCGRCIVSCPVDIDITEVLRDVQDAYDVDTRRRYYHGFSAGAHWGYKIGRASCRERV